MVSFKSFSMCLLKQYKINSKGKSIPQVLSLPETCKRYSCALRSAQDTAQLSSVAVRDGALIRI